MLIDEMSVVKKIESTAVSAAGTVPIEAYLSDYRNVDGILISHKLVIKVLNQERVQTITSITHNAKLTEDRFQPPAAVKAIANK